MQKKQGVEKADHREQMRKHDLNVSLRTSPRFTPGPDLISSIKFLKYLKKLLQLNFLSETEGLWRY